MRLYVRLVGSEGEAYAPNRLPGTETSQRRARPLWEIREIRGKAAASVACVGSFFLPERLVLITETIFFFALSVTVEFLYLTFFCLLGIIFLSIINTKICMFSFVLYQSCHVTFFKTFS